MKHLLLISLIISAILNCTNNNRLSGTADDVNNGSLFGELVDKNGKKIGDTVKVCLYDENSINGLIKVRSTNKNPMHSFLSTNGNYEFDSLTAGTYRIEVLKDSIVVGEKGGITIKNGEDREVNITIVIIINQTFIIMTDESQHITINNFYIDNGKITESDSGYVLTTAENDTIVFEMEIEDNGETRIATGQIIRDKDGNTTFTILDSTEVGISIQSDTVSIDTVSTANKVPSFITQSDEMLDTIFVNSTFLDTIHATDPDGDALTMILLVNPEDMILEDTTISWIPVISDTGSHSVEVIVNDGNEGLDTLSWTIQVLSPVSGNHVPLITSLPEDMKVSIEVYSLYTDTIHATDPDDDPIIFMFKDSVAGMSLSDSIITWIPDQTDIGINTISVVVIDNKDAADTLTWIITVNNSEKHTVAQPATPSGPDFGEPGKKYGFSTAPFLCSHNDSHQYRFSWGNGTYGTWSTSPSDTVIWPDFGIYTVRVQARCSADTTVVSVESDGFRVVILNGTVTEMNWYEAWEVVPAPTNSPDDFPPDTIEYSSTQNSAHAFISAAATDSSCLDAQSGNAYSQVGIEFSVNGEEDQREQVEITISFSCNVISILDGGGTGDAILYKIYRDKAEIVSDGQSDKSSYNQGEIYHTRCTIPEDPLPCQKALEQTGDSISFSITLETGKTYQIGLQVYAHADICEGIASARSDATIDNIKFTTVSSE